MQDMDSQDPELSSRSLGDVLTGMAQDGAKQASRGFAEMIQDRPIGSSDSPEANLVQSRPYHEAVAGVARGGLDVVMGRGFDRDAHDGAADQYLEERRRGGRESDSQSRDFG